MRDRRQIALVSALLIRAAPRSALLGSLLQQKRLAALRTFFFHGFVPEDSVAFRIIRAAIEYFSATGFLHDDVATTAGPRTFHPGGFLLDVFALGIVRARDKFAEASLPTNELSAIDRTLLVNGNWRRSDSATLGDFANILALGITRATIERAEATTL